MLETKHLYLNVRRYLKRNKYTAFFFFLVKRFNYFNLVQVASSLTYTTLLAIVPFLTIALVVIKAFPVFEHLTEKFNSLLTTFLLPDGALAIQEYIQEFVAKAGSLTTIGILMLIASSLLLMMTIEKTFNNIWNSRQKRSILFRLLIYWTVLTLGPLALALMSSLFSNIIKPSDFSINYPLFSTVAMIGLSVFLTSLLIGILFAVVPTTHVPLRHAFIGGLLTAIVLEIVKRGFGFYVQNFHAYEFIYGAFATIPLFLIWIFCLWYVLLAGAVLTSSLSHWKNETFRRAFKRDPLFDHVLAILFILAEAQKTGEVVNMVRFRKLINIGFDDLGQILNRLQDYGYIVESNKGYVLIVEPDSISVEVLFRRFVYHPTARESSVIAAELGEILGPAFDSLDITLSEFMRRLEGHQMLNQKLKEVGITEHPAKTSEEYFESREDMDEDDDADRDSPKDFYETNVNLLDVIDSRINVGRIGGAKIVPNGAIIDDKVVPSGKYGMPPMGKAPKIDAATKLTPMDAEADSEEVSKGSDKKDGKDAIQSEAKSEAKTGDKAESPNGTDGEGDGIDDGGDSGGIGWDKEPQSNENSKFATSSKEKGGKAKAKSYRPTTHGLRKSPGNDAQGQNPGNENLS